MIATHYAMLPTVAVALCSAVVVLTGFTHGPVSPAGPANLQVASSDLNFSRPQDVQTLLERMQDASVDACGGAPDFRDVRRISAFEQCRRTAIRRAVVQLNQPLVTEIAEVQTLGMRLAVR